MHALIRDIRHSVRTLRTSPGFSAVATLILALGIGATTTVSSIANAMMFRPLNSGASGDLIRLYSRDRTAGAQRPYRRFSYPNFLDLRERRDIFEDLSAFDMGFLGVTEGSMTRRVFAAFVSSNYFSMLRVPMARGRAFTTVDDQPGAPLVAVASHGYWSKGGADPDLLGRTLVVNGRPCTIVGIAPKGFTGTMAVAAPPLWLPLSQMGSWPPERGSAASLTDRNLRSFTVVGRLAPGLTLASARPRLETLSRQLEQSYPAENRNQALEAYAVPRVGDSNSPGSSSIVAMALTFVLAMATMLLLVAALNLANMLLARGSLRQREIAIRLAVGASRWSVVRQLLVEASMLSAAGGLLGLCLAYAGSRLIVSTLTPLLPMFLIVFDPSPDIRVLLATLVFAAFGTVVFGLGPALRLSRRDVVTTLNLPITGLPAGKGFSRAGMRHGLVVAQIALSLTLLTAGGLFFFGALRAGAAQPGFSLERGLVAAIDPNLAGYDEGQARTAYRLVLERLRSRRDVASASLASTVPYGESSYDRRVQRAGAAPGDPAVSAEYRVIGADYFRTLSVPVVRGREFTIAEETTASQTHPIIIDSELAKRLWPGEEPLGRNIQWERVQPGGTAGVPYEVVGVVGSIRARLFDTEPRPHVYVPFGGGRETAMTIHVRTALAGSEAEAAMLGVVRNEIRAVDATLPVVSLKTLREHRDTGYEMWFVKLTANVFGIFGVVALVVAAVGIYGVRAFMVGRRTREFGIRVAIGATTGDLLRMVLVEGVHLVVAGVGVGLVLSAGLSRLLAGWIYGVSAFDPVVFGTTSLLLVAAMLLACYLPARRAAAVQPAVALRNQ